jgi:hypothetical protein
LHLLQDCELAGSGLHLTPQILLLGQPGLHSKTLVFWGFLKLKVIVNK